MVQKSNPARQRNPSARDHPVTSWANYRLEIVQRGQAQDEPGEPRPKLRRDCFCNSLHSYLGRARDCRLSVADFLEN